MRLAYPEIDTGLDNGLQVDRHRMAAAGDDALVVQVGGVQHVPQREQLAGTLPEQTHVVRIGEPVGNELGPPMGGAVEHARTLQVGQAAFPIDPADEAVECRVQGNRVRLVDDAAAVGKVDDHHGAGAVVEISAAALERAERRQFRHGKKGGNGVTIGRKPVEKLHLCRGPAFAGDRQRAPQRRIAEQDIARKLLGRHRLSQPAQRAALDQARLPHCRQGNVRDGIEKVGSQSLRHRRIFAPLDKARTNRPDRGLGEGLPERLACLERGGSGARDGSSGLGAGRQAAERWDPGRGGGRDIAERGFRQATPGEGAAEGVPIAERGDLAPFVDQAAGRLRIAHLPPAGQPFGRRHRSKDQGCEFVFGQAEIHFGCSPRLAAIMAFGSAQDGQFPTPHPSPPASCGTPDAAMRLWWLQVTSQYTPGSGP